MCVAVRAVENSTDKSNGVKKCVSRKYTFAKKFQNKRDHIGYKQINRRKLCPNEQ